MAKFDRQLVLYISLLIFGLTLTAVAFLGEFVFHWWDGSGGA